MLRQLTRLKIVDNDDVVRLDETSIQNITLTNVILGPQVEIKVGCNLLEVQPTRRDLSPEIVLEVVLEFRKRVLTGQYEGALKRLDRTITLDHYMDLSLIDVLEVPTLLLTECGCNVQGALEYVIANLVNLNAELTIEHSYDPELEEFKPNLEDFNDDSAEKLLVSVRLDKAIPDDFDLCFTFRFGQGYVCTSYGNIKDFEGLIEPEELWWYDAH